MTQHGTQIEWTHVRQPDGRQWRGETWNWLAGCSKVSAGCFGCYAMSGAWRMMHNPNPKIAAKYEGTAQIVNGHAAWTGRLNVDADKLLEPLRKTAPRAWFVNSMSDIGHPDVPTWALDRMMAVVALCPQHIFMALTKRPERLLGYLSDPGVLTRIATEMCGLGHADASMRLRLPLPNLWVGTSVENAEVLHRLDTLRDIPNAMPWVSMEPLIGPVDIAPHLDFLRWVVLGGESGKRARPMHPLWARDVRDACAVARVPFFFKQWGVWAPQYYADQHGARVVKVVEPKEPVLTVAGEWAPSGVCQSAAAGPVNMKRSRGAKWGGEAGHTLDGKWAQAWPEVA